MGTRYLAATFLLSYLAASELEGVKLEDLQGCQLMRIGKIRRYARLLKPPQGSIPIRLIVFATLLNIAVVFGSIASHDGGQRHQNQSKEEGNHASDEEGAKGSVWVWALVHPADASSIVVAVFTILLVYVTYRLVFSTNLLWKAGEIQIAFLRESSERQLRAYVMVDEAAFQSPEGLNSFIHIVVRIRNFGQTPCSHGLVRFQCFIVPDDCRDREIGFTEKSEFQGNVEIAPGHFHCIVIDRTYPISGNWSNLNQQGMVAYLVGRFDYRDAFGRERFMRFQMFNVFGNSATFSNCRVGNETS